MHVVIVGCGRVGAGLATGLVDQGHSVAVVDRKASAFRRLPEGFSGMALEGIGFDRDVLREAGVEKAAALASVTNGDNSNILVARAAKETFAVERVVARIYDPRRAAIYQRLGIHTVATVSWATERVMRWILPATSAVDWVDPSAKVCLVERSVPSSWAGRSVSELDLPGTGRVVALSRLGVAQVPTRELLVQQSDVIYAAVSGDGLDQFDAHLAAPSSGGKH